jgi:putative ABC transport system ATP-binding protein
MIKLTGINKIYRTNEIETVALENVNLEVNKGEFLSIMGPSGCGKSTLLNMIGLLDNPTSGELWFMDQEVSRYSENDRTDLRNGNLGFVFQSFNLIDELTVFENVELPLLYAGVSTRERVKRVNEALERMQIAHRTEHYPQQLSGGQQQRVAIARAIVTNPRIILADEPTGNLDSTNGNEVMNLLKELNHDGATVVMVTHSEENAREAERIIRMMDGYILTESKNTR